MLNIGHISKTSRYLAYIFIHLVSRRLYSKEEILSLEFRYNNSNGKRKRLRRLQKLFSSTNIEYSYATEPQFRCGMSHLSASPFWQSKIQSPVPTLINS